MAMNGTEITWRQGTAQWRHDNNGGQGRRKHDGNVDAAVNGGHKGQHGIKTLNIDLQLN